MMDEPPDFPRLRGPGRQERAGQQSLLGRAHEVVAELVEKPFAFWYDGKGRLAEQYSFRRTWAEAGKIAYMLREEWGVPKGAMVVLCYGPGMHFFAAFLGCLRAGVVAVMVYPPAPPLSKSLPKMSKIVVDCKPLLCLTDTTIAAVRRVDRANPLSDSRKLWPEDLDFKATDGGLLPSFFSSSSSSDALRSFDEPSVTEEDLAFLQYTSGSTGDPKGVMVTFGALMANVYLIGCHPATGMCRMWPSDKAGDSSSDQPEASSSGPGERPAPSQRLHHVPTTGFSWLPQYHDMGLVLGLLTPFLTGMTMHYMSPVTFIKRPLLWLELVSRHRVEWSVAPDFAYALCARYMAKVRGTRKEPKLDLSSVVTLTSGAEPIRTETVERFEAAFLPFGLRQGWFSAAYGLAEHVVSVSWATVLDRSPSRTDLTSVGSPGDRLDFMDIRIVNLDTRVEVSEAAATGEIWISSPSVAAGYWGKPELSKETFGATLALPKGGAEGSDDSDVSSHKYLRTGDVGFVEEGLLYICGRIKDLIIFNGVNHYPQDVEFAVQEASSAVRQGCIAAFSSDETGGDGVLEVVFEIRQERESEAQAVVEAAQAALSSCLGLRAARVVAVKQKTIPKTTSGKIRRRATRQALHAGELHMVRELTEDTASGQGGRAVAMSQDPPLDDLASTRPTPEDRPRSVEGEVPERRGERESSLAIHSMESLGRQARVAIILEEIIGFAVEVTHNRALTADDRFMEAGMTSVMMAELAVMLENFLGSERTEEEGDKDFELGAEAFFDYPTPALLAAHVETTLFGEGEGDDASADGLPPSLLSDSGSDIAVIGMACRFPAGCNSPEELWAKLCNEEDCVTDAPSERGLGAGVRGGFIDTVEAFDNAFFGMSIPEAEAQDPNQRIMLEVAYEALHRAGYEGRHRLEGHRVGVFVGVAGSDWPTLLYENPQLTKGNPYVLAGASRACIATRISHTLGLEGPCESVDTACSSAIVALNNACKSLRLRESRSAIVGGVNLLLHHQAFGGLADARLLSKEGCCKSFDARGDGYVRSEGSGAVVLKLLPEAIKDGDRILAVIKAAAVSHSGVSSSLSAPKGTAQESLVRRALRQAGCEGREVSYVEAHATGTVIGDSIEMGALKAVFTSNRPEASPLVVGTVKTTLGHMEGASGMAQLIKAILVLQHREAPANLHQEEVNPKLKLEGVPVTLPTRRTPLSSCCSDGSTLLAGVNSYGVGGVNAHVILGSYGDMRPEGAAERGDTPWQGFPSSREFPLPQRAAPTHDGKGPTSPPPPAGDVLSDAAAMRPAPLADVALLPAKDWVKKFGDTFSPPSPAGSVGPGELAWQQRFRVQAREEHIFRVFTDVYNRMAAGKEDDWTFPPTLEELRSSKELLLDRLSGSLSTVGLCAQLTKALQLDAAVRPTDIYSHPSFSRLFSHLCSRVATPPATVSEEGEEKEGGRGRGGRGVGTSSNRTTSLGSSSPEAGQRGRAAVATEGSAKDRVQDAPQWLLALLWVCAFAYLSWAILLPMYGFVRCVFKYAQDRSLLFAGGVVVPAGWLTYLLLQMAVVILSKRLLVPPVRAGCTADKIQRRSAQFIAWWTMQRLMGWTASNHSFLLRRSPLLVLYYRALGATIGCNVILDTTELYDPEWVVIGDNSVVNKGVIFRTHIVGIRDVSFGTASVDARCSVEPWVVVNQGGRLPSEHAAGALAEVRGRPKGGMGVNEASLSARTSSAVEDILWTVLRLYFVVLVVAVGTFIASRALFKLLSVGGIYPTDETRALGFASGLEGSSATLALLMAWNLAGPLSIPFFAVFPGINRGLVNLVLMRVLKQHYLFGALWPGALTWVVYTAAMCTIVALIKWAMLLPRKPRTTPVSSFEALRRALVADLMAFTSRTVMPFTVATQAENAWLASMGARFGLGVTSFAEYPYEPELLSVGTQSHLGIPSAPITGMFKVDAKGRQRYVTGTVRIGDNALLGAFCVALPGASIPADCEVGALSVVRESDELQARSTCLGGQGGVSSLPPPVDIISRVNAPGGQPVRVDEPRRSMSDRRLQTSLASTAVGQIGGSPLLQIATGSASTEKLSALQVFAMLLMPVLQPCVLALHLYTLAALVSLAISKVVLQLGDKSILVTLPLWLLLFLALVAVTSAALKWAVMPTRRKAHSFTRSSLEYVRWTSATACQTLAMGTVVELLAGSPLLPWYLRLLGLRAGSNVHIDCRFVPDPDLLTLEDDVVVERHAMPQCHILEHGGVMYVESVRVGKGARLNARSLTLPGFVLGEGATLDVSKMGAKGYELTLGARSSARVV